MIAEVLNIINKNLFLIFLIILISLLSFQLGRISKTASQPIKIEKASIQEIFNDQNTNIRVDTNEASRGEGKDLKVDFRVVVSKNGTKYHFAWCPSAKRIKPENQIWFNSEQEAISAGYTLASNCSK
ncbi:MAG: hypothetical protein AAB627_00835 [Patescibacteria group bacterium]